MPKNSVNKIMSDYYLGIVPGDVTDHRLTVFPSEELAERLLDCFNREQCRALFCEENGTPHKKE